MTFDGNQIGEPPARPAPRRAVIITTLGITQIIAWGSTYYLLAVLGPPIAAETSWPLSVVISGLTLGLLCAGAVSPRVGRAVQATGGRPVLAFSSIVIACGLILLAIATNMAVYFLAWIVLGIGMGAGLYDAAFATLGRLYGAEARPAITALTLFGGFASTFAWPLSAVLVESVGWRGACLAYAGLHLLVTLPLHLFLLPGSGGGRLVWRDLLGGAPVRAGRIDPRERRLILLVAAALTAGGATSAALSVHLLTILQARDIALAAAVAFGALVGPSQVGGRIIEMLAGRKRHPLWSAGAAALLSLGGIGALALELPVIALALVLYGAGTGIRSIVRGALPLALFGASDYAALMGRLALPQFVAGALAPLAGAFIIDWRGPTTLLALLTALAAAEAVLIALVAVIARGRPEAALEAPERAPAAASLAAPTGTADRPPP